MDIVKIIKTNTHWKDVISIKKEYPNVYFQPGINEKEIIQDIRDIYTDGTMSDYVLVIVETGVYIGTINDNQIICFGKLDTLEEACSAL